MPMMPVLTHDKGESSKVHQRQTHASRNVYAVNNSKICKKMMRPVINRNTVEYWS
jgi:hypothetical protein